MGLRQSLPGMISDQIPDIFFPSSHFENSEVPKGSCTGLQNRYVRVQFPPSPPLISREVCVPFWPKGVKLEYSWALHGGPSFRCMRVVFNLPDAQPSTEASGTNPLPSHVPLLSETSLYQASPTVRYRQFLTFFVLFKAPGMYAKPLRGVEYRIVPPKLYRHP